MKCPACKKRLKTINSLQRGEYVCDNDDCPANISLQEGYGFISGYFEFYGRSQEEINKQWPIQGKERTN